MYTARCLSDGEVTGACINLCVVNWFIRNKQTDEYQYVWWDAL